MRIDRTNSFKQHGPSGDNDKHVKPAQADGAKGAKSAAGPAAEGATILSAEPSLVRRAAATPEIDTKAVEQARQLLKAGLLDTPKAAEAAAEAIISRGL